MNGSGKTALGIRENGSPPIPKESEETLVCRRKSLAIFDVRRRVPRKFMEFSGDRKNKIFDEINNTWICLIPLRGIRQMKIFLSTHFMGR